MEALERHIPIQICLCSALCCGSALKGCSGTILKRSCQFQSLVCVWAELTLGIVIHSGALWLETYDDDWLMSQHEYLVWEVLATSGKSLNIQMLAGRILSIFTPYAPSLGVSGTTTKQLSSFVELRVISVTEAILIWISNCATKMLLTSS